MAAQWPNAKMRRCTVRKQRKNLSIVGLLVLIWKSQNESLKIQQGCTGCIGAFLAALIRNMGSTAASLGPNDFHGTTTTTCALEAAMEELLFWFVLVCFLIFGLLERVINTQSYSKLVWTLSLQLTPFQRRQKSISLQHVEERKDHVVARKLLGNET